MARGRCTGTRHAVRIRTSHPPETDSIADTVHAAHAIELHRRQLVAPVLSKDDSVDIYLPGRSATNDAWFEFNTSVFHSAPRSLSLHNVPLDHLPVYVKAGSILPLAPLIQHTEQLPGGPLEVQVYAVSSGGSDATFTLVEDDGETDAYISGQQRRTLFKWEDQTHTLSWEVAGDFADDHTFTQLKVIFFKDGAGGRRESAVQPIGTAGSVSWASLNPPVSEGGR